MRKEKKLTRMVEKDGSIQIPPEALAILGIDPGGLVRLEIEENSIYLYPVEAKCEVCGQSDDLMEVNGCYFCGACADTISIVRRKAID